MSPQAYRGHYFINKLFMNQSLKLALAPQNFTERSNRSSLLYTLNTMPALSIDSAVNAFLCGNFDIKASTGHLSGVSMRM